MKIAYKTLQQAINRKKDGGFGDKCLPLFEQLFFEARLVLSRCERLELVSKVPSKSYFSFVSAASRSRPVNDTLYDDGENAIQVFRMLLEGKRHDLTSDSITRSVYTVAMACCAAIDVTSKGDQKTPGTIFEWICAALIQACLKVRPTRSLQVLNLDLNGDLPTDFVFGLGPEMPKFHLPVKTSTRERIIQVWAHQRVLDGVYGVGRFLAMPIVLTETKVDSNKLEIIEICLPWQWRLYQMHIALLWNVCYLDAPRSYLELDTKFPRIGVCTLGDVLVEGGRLDKLLKFHDLL